MEHKPLELDATTLTYEEWFFIWAAFGQKPDASLKDVGEWSKRSLGMTPQQKQMTFRVGLESLIQRGAVKLGDKTPEGEQEFIPNFRVVSRIREVQSNVTAGLKQ